MVNLDFPLDPKLLNRDPQETDQQKKRIEEAANAKPKVISIAPHIPGNTTEEEDLSFGLMYKVMKPVCASVISKARSEPELASAASSFIDACENRPYGYLAIPMSEKFPAVTQRFGKSPSDFGTYFNTDKVAEFGSQYFDKGLTPDERRSMIRLFSHHSAYHEGAHGNINNARGKYLEESDFQLMSDEQLKEHFLTAETYANTYATLALARELSLSSDKSSETNLKLFLTQISHKIASSASMAQMTGDVKDKLKAERLGAPGLEVITKAVLELTTENPEIFSKFGTLSNEPLQSLASNIRDYSIDTKVDNADERVGVVKDLIKRAVLPGS